MDERGDGARGREASLWRAAQGLVGARFRRGGRDPEFGLDCVGVALFALRGAGASIDEPAPYATRGGDARGWSRRLAEAGLRRCRVRVHTGDIVLIDCGEDQFHIAVAGPASSVHAHAGLRRVVEVPGLPDGVVHGRWYAPDTLFDTRFDAVPTRGE